MAGITCAQGTRSRDHINPSIGPTTIPTLVNALHGEKTPIQRQLSFAALHAST
jgi:hypothetical protein